MEVMSVLWTIAQVYIALAIVVVIHELGHFPKRIKFKFGFLPSAVAVQAKYRLGGLIANTALFIIIFFYKPEWLLLQYVGLIAWAHFIVYTVLGAIIPEPKESMVNIKTYVFDDVNNKYMPAFWLAALIAFLLFKSYYLPILIGVFA